MARHIMIGNDSLLVPRDADTRMRDIAFPYPGDDNHTPGHPCHFRLCVDGHRHLSETGSAARLDDVDDILKTNVRQHHERRALDVTCRDSVDVHEHVSLHDRRVRSLAPSARLIQTFFSQNVHLAQRTLGHTTLRRSDTPRC